MSSQMNQKLWPGNHDLLPAFKPGIVARAPTYSFVAWTFGRGSVIWRIWPAVLLYTTFAVGIVTLTIKRIIYLQIPTIMLTVLGVVIGFVISYRAGSGYDRYWMGRTAWSDVIKNSRTLSRLVWFHVPPRISPKTPEEARAGKASRSVEEMKKIMAEKKMALDLVAGFSVSLKHHLRGELGIYYQDLYHLVKPLHDHQHDVVDYNRAPNGTLTARLHPSKRHTEPSLSGRNEESSDLISFSIAQGSPVDCGNHNVDMNPIIPPINAYGTFDVPVERNIHRLRRQPSNQSSSSCSSQHQPLLNSSQEPQDKSVLGAVSSDLIPFAGLLGMFHNLFRRKIETVSPEGDQNNTNPSSPFPKRVWQGPVYSGLHTKHRPYVAGGGESLPLEILRQLSNWFSVLEERGTVPGTSLGQMIALLSAFEDNLTGLERILTTPLPFVYSVHIRHTVWLYLFFLPFQLVGQFGWYTIPGVALAAFIYLGFVAAGEEIEQPFGYDENDLDLDLFCHEIIYNDIKYLKSTPCVNAYFAPEIQKRPDVVHRQSMTLVELSERHYDELF